MGSHLDAFKAWCEMVGLKYQETHGENGYSPGPHSGPHKSAVMATTLRFNANEADNIIGYIGFSAEYHFDENGSFVIMGVWE